VGMLLIFDSGVPGAGSAKPKPVRPRPARKVKRPIGRRARRARKMMRRARKRVLLAVRRRRRALRTWWRALGRMERKRHAQDSALRSLAGRARALFGDPQAEREREIIDAHRRAKRLYVPRVYPGRITLIRSSEFASRDDKEAHLLWGNLAGGGFDSEVVPGGHQTLFKEPHVRSLAERVRACIYRAELETGGNGTPATEPSGEDSAVAVR
jgi:thioesterase domain-containing protein